MTAPLRTLGASSPLSSWEETWAYAGGGNRQIRCERGGPMPRSSSPTANSQQPTSAAVIGRTAGEARGAEVGLLQLRRSLLRNLPRWHLLGVVVGTVRTSWCQSWRTSDTRLRRRERLPRRKPQLLIEQFSNVLLDECRRIREPRRPTAAPTGSSAARRARSSIGASSGTNPSFIPMTSARALSRSGNTVRRTGPADDRRGQVAGRLIGKSNVILRAAVAQMAARQHADAPAAGLAAAPPAAP